MDAVYPEIGEYMAYLRTHGRKDSTIDTMTYLLRRLFTALEEGGRNHSVHTLTPEDMVWLHDTLDVSESVCRSYLTSLNHMVERMDGRELLGPADIQWNREVHNNRVFITLEQFSTLYRAADPPTRVILALGAFMGLRRTEMSKLRWSDIRGNRAAIHGKGHGPQGLVVDMDIPAPVWDALKEFERYRDRQGGKVLDDAVVQFRDCRGEWHGIHPVVLARKVTDLGDEQGIRVTTHSLRRLYATTLANDVGADLNTVRLLLRHADVSTTVKCYINPDPARLIAASDELSEVISASIGV